MSETRAEVTAQLADGAASGLTPLPRVLHEAPAAVLLVDTDTGQVAVANEAAVLLAGGELALPVAASEWSQRAGVRRPDGEEFGGEDSPIARVGNGQPVLGEPVVVLTPEGPVPRWVTGVPLPAQAGLAGSALVVFFEIDIAGGGGGDALSRLRDRAVISSELSFTISDPHQPDNPLVWVNEAFTRLTGYSFEESTGRNCRFLQGPDTDPAAPGLFREAMARTRAQSVTVLNYRKDGTAFYNEVAISPVVDATGEVTHYVAVQADVTQRVRDQQARERALSDEQAARRVAEEALRAAEQARREAEAAQARAEQAQTRLGLLAEATTLLGSTLDVDDTLARLTRLVVPLLADLATVDLVEERDGRRRARRVAVAHRDESVTGRLLEVGRNNPVDLAGDTPLARVLRGGEAELRPTLTADSIRQAVASEEEALAYRSMVGESAMVLPLRARDRVFGALTLTSGPDRQFTEADLVLAGDLARRAALALDNARLYSREHETAVALQQSLLPVLPQVPGLDVAHRYLASVVGTEVGGDWYDVLALPDGATGLVIGDVMGHDLAAAAAMGQLRSVLRSYAFDEPSTAGALDRTDRLVQGLGSLQLATVLYARLEPVLGGGARLRWTSAGHLPPVLQGPDGSARLLTGPSSPLVGAGLSGDPRAESVVPMPAGSTLLLYTDGLVERRGQDIDDALGDLVTTVSTHAPRDGAEALCERVLSTETGRPGGNPDDVAVLAVRVL